MHYSYRNNFHLPLAKYDHRPEILENVRQETQGILDDALVQRGLPKVSAHKKIRRSYIGLFSTVHCYRNICMMFIRAL